ncbi:MAG TPA: hypothetical protein VEG60_10555 [Candidatus Binatia bacterium]|nr:hypothetical protein [Candidatus Binatia bacterium]
MRHSVRFTLDTNCIIDVEEGRPSAPFLRELVALHGKSGINVAVSAIGASERQRAGGYASSFSEFRKKLKAVGFDSLELLAPLAYWDITYLDHCVLGDENDTLERDIHEVLFPGIEFLKVDYAKARGIDADTVDTQWRNAKCDVLTMWCHIRHGGGVLVTSDMNFHSEGKRDKLQALGAGTVALPSVALAVAKNYPESGYATFIMDGSRRHGGR